MFGLKIRRVHEFERLLPTSFWIGLRTALLVLPLCLVPAVASSAVTISVSEFVFNVTTAEMLDTSFVIHNGDAEAIALEISVVDWNLAEGNVTMVHPAGTIEQSCATWLTAVIETNSLDPNEEASVALRIRPDVERAGTSWCGVLVRIRQANGDERGGITAMREFLVKILVTVLPGETAARVRSVSPYGKDPFWAAVEFENTGEVFLQSVDGWMVLENGRGEELFRTELPTFDSLPGSITWLEARWEWGLLIPGIYLVRAVFDLGEERLLAGETAFQLRSLSLEPVPGAQHAPADLDGDGLYEDIDGDGSFDGSDVEALSAHFERVSMQRNARAFDFDNDGALSDSDVLSLNALVLQEEK